MSYYPWHIDLKNQLAARLLDNKLPHGLLLHGPIGIGKYDFAVNFSQFLLCSEPVDGSACDVCKTCNLFKAHTHGDFFSIGVLDDKKTIGVDQIRELSTALTLSSQFGLHKVALINPADMMTTNAANSLLKTLEEPPNGTFILLVTDNPSYLPATIRSRCQLVSMTIPQSSVASEWLGLHSHSDCNPDLCLSISNGSPLEALRFIESGRLNNRLEWFSDFEKLLSKKYNAVNLSEKWLKEDLLGTIQCMDSWLRDMIQLKSVSSPPCLGNPDLRERLRQLSQSFDLPTLFQRLDVVQKALSNSRTTMNEQLLIDDILLSWNMD